MADAGEAQQGGFQGGEQEEHPPLGERSADGNTSGQEERQSLWSREVFQRQVSWQNTGCLVGVLCLCAWLQPH